jgi:hypothetical protein
MRGLGGRQDGCDSIFSRRLAALPFPLYVKLLYIPLGPLTLPQRDVKLLYLPLVEVGGGGGGALYVLVC